MHMGKAILPLCTKGSVCAFTTCGLLSFVVKAYPGPDVSSVTARVVLDSWQRLVRYV